jgi:GAF domain-containing protein
VEQVKNHPRFKYFSEAGEEPYQSFLGVPLIDRGVLQGVLVVQTIGTRAFRDDEIQMLLQAAAQVAPVVSEARTLDRFIAPAQERLWALARNLWSSVARERWSCIAASIMPIAASGNIWRQTAPGEHGMPASCGRVQ